MRQLSNIKTEVKPQSLAAPANGNGKRNTASKLHVFVDATTGAVADSYDEVREGTGNSFYVGSVTIATSGSGSSFSMADSTRPGIRCGGQNGATFTGTDNVWGNGSGTSLETGCVDVLYGVQKEWDMLSSWLGRNGINGSGSGFPARVGLNQVNAFWNGSNTSFGHSPDKRARPPTSTWWRTSSATPCSRPPRVVRAAATRMAASTSPPATSSAR